MTSPQRGRPIADNALISDCRGAALVAGDGAIEWWCAPRFDSRASFARVLGERAGHWTLAGSGALIGNFPQTISHVGLSSAAWSIDRAADRARSEQRSTA